MVLTITEVNLKSGADWIYKLNDGNKNIFYIKQEAFYNKHNLKSPITKKELDQYEKGVVIRANVRLIEGLNVAVSVY